MTAYQQRALDCLREFVAFEQHRMEDERSDCAYRSVMIGLRDLHTSLVSTAEQDGLDAKSRLIIMRRAKELRAAIATIGGVEHLVLGLEGKKPEPLT